MFCYLRKIEVQWEEKYNDFSLILWGTNPNVTKIHHSIIIKIDEYVYRPDKYNLSFVTLDEKVYDNGYLNSEQIR